MTAFNTSRRRSGAITRAARWLVPLVCAFTAQLSLAHGDVTPQALEATLFDACQDAMALDGAQAIVRRVQ